MSLLVTDYTLRKIMSANDQGIVAVASRAHCQRQVAFLIPSVTLRYMYHNLQFLSTAK